MPLNDPSQGQGNTVAPSPSSITSGIAGDINSINPTNAPPIPGSQFIQVGGGTTPGPNKVSPTQGWYVFGGLVVSIALSGTKAAPFIMGVLSIALIYQLSALLEHIPPSTNAPSFGSLIPKTESAPATAAP